MNGFKIDVQSNIKQVQKQLTSIERSAVPLAAAKAITFTAERAQKALSETTRQVFRRPTRFTQNAFRKTSARPTELVAYVYLKDIHAFRDHYLQVHIDGGIRPQKRSEQRLGGYWVPSKYARNKKMTRGRMSKILADVGGFGRMSGDAANTHTKAQGGKKKIKYFMTGVMGHRIIFEKTGKTGAIPVLVEVNKKPSYRVRLPMRKIVNAQVRINFNKLFSRQLSREIKRITNVNIELRAA